MNNGYLQVKVWGDWACFTRPEMKVERVSYPVMTPAAARGVLEAIFWKPEISWQVREIWVLRPIRYFSILRNEVNSDYIASKCPQGMEKEGGDLFINDDEEGTGPNAIPWPCGMWPTSSRPTSPSSPMPTPIRPSTGTSFAGG